MSITDTNDTSTEHITEEDLEEDALKDDPVEDDPEDEDGEAESVTSRVSAPIRVIPATDAQPLVTIRGLL